MSLTEAHLMCDSYVCMNVRELSASIRRNKGRPILEFNQAFPLVTVVDASYKTQITLNIGTVRFTVSLSYSIANRATLIHVTV